MKEMYKKDFARAVEFLKFSRAKITLLAYHNECEHIMFVPDSDNTSENMKHFFNIIDCSTDDYKIVDMRDMIPDFIACKILHMESIMKKIDSGKRVDFNTAQEFYTLHSQVTNFMDCNFEL